MNKCTISGCRSLQTVCTDCARVVCVRTFQQPFDWISVKDKLPPPDEEDEGNSIFVLLTNGTQIGLGSYEYEYFAQDDEDPVTYSSPSWYDATSHISNDVTHWMPLPKPPEKK